MPVRLQSFKHHARLDGAMLELVAAISRGYATGSIVVHCPATALMLFAEHVQQTCMQILPLLT